MPTYEYEYTRKDGTKIQVTRTNVPMKDSDKKIMVTDEEDGNRYRASRIMSLTADMSYSWTDDVRNSDLPPEDATPEDVAKAMRK